MQLWILWWRLVKELKPCFSRQQTFLWFILIMIGFSVRQDIVGVTSLIRALGLDAFYYDRLLDFFHSPAIKLNMLVEKWFRILLKTGLSHKVNGRLIILGDGIKTPKEGKKMPAVKSLHQSSESNSKPEYIMGHSFQAISLLTTAAGYFFSTPVICRIHEGIVESNRDQRTLMDKMILMIDAVKIEEPFYFVADAYYATGKIVLNLLTRGQHLITRVRKNAVAYLPSPQTTNIKRGRPQIYGKKIKLSDILKDKEQMVTMKAAIYDEPNVTVLYRSIDLIWKPIGSLVRFVFVIHPTRGAAIFMSTDLSLLPLDIIQIYSLRYKIEVSFKQAVRTIGVYTYHFWMKNMDRIKRKSGDQYLHKKSKSYRYQVNRKIAAYHTHVQFGLIAQGLLQILSMTAHQLIWKNFGSWIRTIRPNILPSEQIVMSSLRNTLPEFLKVSSTSENIEKFVLDKLDLNRAEGQRMVV